MARIDPPLKYDQLKGTTVTDKSWRRAYDNEDRWKKKLSDLLDGVPDNISPHTHSVIENFIERLLEDRR